MMDVPAGRPSRAEALPADAGEPNGEEPETPTIVVAPPASPTIVAGPPASPTIVAGPPPAPAPPAATSDDAVSPPAFAHESEAELARILDFYAVRWEYEPHTYPILWDLDGSVLESFSPDFYLPDLDMYIELTTLKQRLVRKKNRKLRRLRELYPDIRIKLFYARDFRMLMLKYGKVALVDALSGTSGQVVPPPRPRVTGTGNDAEADAEPDVEIEHESAIAEAAAGERPTGRSTSANPIDELPFQPAAEPRTGEGHTREGHGRSRRPRHRRAARSGDPGNGVVSRSAAPGGEA